MHTPTKQEFVDAANILSDRGERLRVLPVMSREWKVAAHEKTDVEGWLRIARERGETRLPLTEAFAAH